MRIGRGTKLALLGLGLVVGGLMGCDGSITSGMPAVKKGLAAEVRACLLDPESCPPDYPSTPSRYTDESIPSPPITITSEELSQVCDYLEEHAWETQALLGEEERNRPELASSMRKMLTVVHDLGFSNRWHDPESDSYADVDRWFQWMAEQGEEYEAEQLAATTDEQSAKAYREYERVSTASIRERGRQFHQLICKGY